MRSRTDALPRGQSYPLKPSLLFSALADAGVSIETSLARSPGASFAASFDPPNASFAMERLVISAGSVPSERVAEARSRIELVMVRPLVAWITDILKLDANSTVRRERHMISFDL